MSVYRRDGMSESSRPTSMARLLVNSHCFGLSPFTTIVPSTLRYFDRQNQLPKVKKVCPAQSWQVRTVRVHILGSIDVHQLHKRRRGGWEDGGRFPKRIILESEEIRPFAAHPGRLTTHHLTKCPTCCTSA